MDEQINQTKPNQVHKGQWSASFPSALSSVKEALVSIW